MKENVMIGGYMKSAMYQVAIDLRMLLDVVELIDSGLKDKGGV